MSSKVSPLGFRLNKGKNWKFNFLADKKNYPFLFSCSSELEVYLQTVLNSKKLKFIKILVYNNSNTVYLYVYYKISFFKFFKIRNFNFKKFKTLIHYKKKNYKFFKKLKLYKKIFNFLIIKRIKIFLYLKYLNIKISKMYSNYCFKVYFFPFNYLKNLNKSSLKLYKNFLKNNKLKKISKLIIFSVINRNSFVLSRLILNFLFKRKNHKKYINFIINDLKFLLNLNKFFLGFKIQLKGKLNGKLRSKVFSSKTGNVPLSTCKSLISYNYLPMKTRFGIFGIKVWLVYKN